jgi:hypothetical protein
MTVHYWLYTDPNDSKSNSIIGVVKTQFPQLVYCSDFDQLQYNISTHEQHIVFLIQPTDSIRAERMHETVWHDQIKKLVSLPIQCVWVVDELFTISRILDWICTFSNLLIVTPGQNTFGMLHYPWVTWQHWLQDAVDVYKHPTMQNYVNTLDSKKLKPQLFDVLLGGERPYRTLLHDWIEQDPVLSSQTIMSYYGGNTTRPKIISEPGIVVNQNQPITHTGIRCHLDDVTTRFAVIPPVSVYQQTAYSVVTETNAQHNYIFFTEKIARVMVCRRMFIAVSSYKYLHYLRESGFKTFGNIINESYDLEVDDVRRWRMAFEQMQQLAKMDQSWVLEQIQPIVEHNLQVLMNTDWHKKMSNNVNQILAARLNFKEA